MVSVSLPSSSPLIYIRGKPDEHRYVPEGHPVVFDITKRKIHNVLQGVAPKDVEMNDEDKKWFELWTQQNCTLSMLSWRRCLLMVADEMFWSDGAIDADLIVIDDPQCVYCAPILTRTLS